MIAAEDIARILGEPMEHRPPLVRVWVLAVAVFGLLVALAILAARCWG